MSSSNCCSSTSKTTLAYLVGGVGSFLIIGALAWLVVRQPVGAVDAERVAQRVKFRAEVEAASGPKATGYALDADALAKGNKVYHVPIARALEIAAQEFKDPAAGRAKLIQRLEEKSKQQSFE
jgi:hypothetical protein